MNDKLGIWMKMISRVPSSHREKALTIFNDNDNGNINNDNNMHIYTEPILYHYKEVLFSWSRHQNMKCRETMIREYCGTYDTNAK